MEGCEAVPRAKLSLCSSSSLTAVTGNISNGFSVLLQRSDLRALWGSVPILLWWGARGSQQVLGTEELGGGGVRQVLCLAFLQSCLLEQVRGKEQRNESNWLWERLWRIS